MSVSDQAPHPPTRLLAPEPGWDVRADVVVVGSGIAGLTTALRARETTGGHVLLVTKTFLDAGSTRWAQGGIAAALDPGDSPQEHLQDTLVAGVGLCDEGAVRVLVEEGPARVRELIEIGAKFDRTLSGEIALTREGGHHRDRIAHAGGDATGLEIERALIAALHADPDIEVIEHALVLDLLRAAEGRVCGLTLHVIGEGARDGVGAVLAGAVVLATGGLGQVFAATTNPSVSTGDGVAVALRAGAEVTDLEFVQFHPTVLWLGGMSRGQQPLVSEALRGEGATLVDEDGLRFMVGQHELAELAPRDVVAKAVMTRMRETGASHVWLDARGFGEDRWRSRFPTILASCRDHGIDPVTELIPVAPACHYISGGVRTDLDGRTSVPGLYACGEVACTGVHGANRLASNSLLEGLVFGHRIAEDLGRGLGLLSPPAPDGSASDGSASDGSASDGSASAGATAGLLDASLRPALQQVMSIGAGVLRSRASLAQVDDALATMSSRASDVPCTENWEATNLHLVATVLADMAARREESRGSHWRADFPDRDDVRWRRHLVTTMENAVVTTRVETAVRLTEDTTTRLSKAGLEPSYVHDLVVRALQEDLAGGVDVTTVATVPSDQVTTADLVARGDGVVAGLAVAAAVFEVASDAALTITWPVDDGATVARGDVLLTLVATTRTLLTGERTALNLLCRLSGVATLTRRWVDAVSGTGAQVRDTRKTTPGLRALEKYAVRCGGGVNHRMSLSDAAMVKDNHVIAAGGVAAAFRAVRREFPDLPVEVEADSVSEAVEAVEAGADLVLLDNMPVDQVREAVSRVAGRARLEASGGLHLDNARAMAETGVDYLAVGALTHSAPVLDIACDLREVD